MTFRLSSPIVGALLLWSAACGDAVAPGGPLAGRWHADSTIYGTLDFTLTQKDSVVQGTGLVLDSVPRALAVIGFYSTFPGALEPIALTFSSVNVIPAIFTGTLGADGRSFSGRLIMTYGLGQDTVEFRRPQ